MSGSLRIQFSLPLNVLISSNILDSNRWSQLSMVAYKCDVCLTHGIAVQQEHSMGTAIIFQCHIVRVNTIGILLVL